jgi:tight adherence protein G
MFSKDRFMVAKMNRFIRTQNGGLALIFAIMLPLIFSCCALVFGGARVLSKRARLADALNEAALVIATAASTKPDDNEKAQLKLMLDRYISAYLPGEPIESSSIIVSYTDDPVSGATLPVFDIRAKVNVKTILPFSIVPSFSPELELSNQGKVRKGLQDLGRPADYVFVVDFSGSMDDPSAEPGMTRIELLKKVVSDITEKALEAFPETTFAIVPFEIGVPVLWDNSITLVGENELSDKPGAVTACSVLMVPKQMYNINLNMEVGFNIDYAFWANKTKEIAKLTAPTFTSSSLPYTTEQVNKILNEGRYLYFNKLVLPSLKREVPSATMTTLTKPPYEWCKVNTGSDKATAPYLCEKSTSNSIASNQALIKAQIERARSVFSEARSGSMFNLQAMDIDATLAGMFDSANVITFPLPYRRYDLDDYVMPYGNMCFSAGNDAFYWFDNAANRMKDVQPNAYLIEPTSDINVLDKFQSMQAGGGTHSSTGLVRAVPEMLKGNNPRKVMIVISDGDDNAQYQPVTDRLHQVDKICDKIRTGVAAKSGAQEVDIYFISVVNDSSGQKRTKYWADYCTGKDNAVVATNYDEIMNKLVEIMNKYEETGYFYN